MTGETMDFVFDISQIVTLHIGIAVMQCLYHLHFHIRGERILRGGGNGYIGMIFLVFLNPFPHISVEHLII